MATQVSFTLNKDTLKTLYIPDVCARRTKHGVSTQPDGVATLETWYLHINDIIQFSF